MEPIRTEFEPRTKPLRMGEDPMTPLGRLAWLFVGVLLVFLVIERLDDRGIFDANREPAEPSLRPPPSSRVSFWAPSELAGGSLFLEWSVEGTPARRKATITALAEDELIALSSLWNDRTRRLHVVVVRESGERIERHVRLPVTGMAGDTHVRLPSDGARVELGEAIARFGPAGVELPSDPAAPDPPGTISLRIEVEK